jgi:hypothetical protein
MDDRRIFFGVAFFCLALTGTIFANRFLTIMIGEINRRRDEQSQISYFGFALPKMMRVFSEYRHWYPLGRYHICALLAFAIGVAGIIGAAIAIGMFGF